MRGIKRALMLLSLFVLLCIGTSAPAMEHITVLDHSIKPITTVSSGRYIKIAWQVKLQNQNDQPLNCLITVNFLNARKEKLGTASKKSEIKANESITVSDTVVLRIQIAQQIKTGTVSVEVDKS